MSATLSKHRGEIAQQLAQAPEGLIKPYALGYASLHQFYPFRFQSPCAWLHESQITNICSDVAAHREIRSPNEPIRTKLSNNIGNEHVHCRVGVLTEHGQTRYLNIN